MRIRVPLQIVTNLQVYKVGHPNNICSRSLRRTPPFGEGGVPSLYGVKNWKDSWMDPFIEVKRYSFTKNSACRIHLLNYFTIQAKITIQAEIVNCGNTLEIYFDFKTEIFHIRA